MQENDLREKYIQILMKKGVPRNIAEETVDIIDDDGNVVGLISENELILELLFRDIFRRPDVLKKLEKDIQEINSLNAVFAEKRFCFCRCRPPVIMIAF